MLKMIFCDKFNQKKIMFHNGLNSVVGDEVATNSIGKTTLLMIIDYVFGGSDYLTKNSDTIDNLGNHEFLFSFEFNNEEYYFKRNTENSSEVTICNDKFEELKKQEVSKYCEWLQKNITVS